MKLHTVTALGTFAFLATSVDAAPKRAGALGRAGNGANIMISEYVEGSYNTKAVELFNPTAQADKREMHTVTEHDEHDAE